MKYARRGHAAPRGLESRQPPVVLAWQPARLRISTSQAVAGYDPEVLASIVFRKFTGDVLLVAIIQGGRAMSRSGPLPLGAVLDTWARLLHDRGA